MRFAVYALRWQLSGLVLAPVIAWIGHPIWSAVVANAAGACLFYLVDTRIFRRGA